MFLKRIEEAMKRGPEIPRSSCDSEPLRFVRWGESRNERALAYSIPTKGSTKRKRSEKRLPTSVFDWAEDELKNADELRLDRFKKKFPEVYKDGSCNFTALNDILVLIGKLVYENGHYRRPAK